MEIVIVLAVCAVMLLIDYLIAKEFYYAAQEKGYDERKYFWICFWLGVVGCLLVVALPTRVSTSKETEVEPIFAESTNIGDGKWRCGYCQTENSVNFGQCKKCGKFRG